MKQKLVVINYETNTVTIYPYDENVWESPEHYTDEEDNHVIHSNCHWLVTDVLNIKLV